MAGRKRRLSVDYFPHFVDSGKTIFTIERMFGNDGYAIIFKTLELLAGSEGHFYSFENEEDWIYICAKFNSDTEIVKSVFDMLAKLRFIDHDLYENKILWCDNLVENLSQVYEKRVEKLPLKPISGSEKPISGSENTQSKVKGSKVKKVYGEFKNVKLSDEEYKKLKDKFNSHLQEKIEKLSEYMESKGKRYKSHYATILSWSRRDKIVSSTEDKIAQMKAGLK